MSRKTFIEATLDSLPGMEKTAFIPDVARNMGKGLWNLAMGGKTHAARVASKGKNIAERWDPLHGIKNVGVVHDTHTEGPLKGMLKYDSETGDPIGKKRGILSYLAQEFKGPKPTRADLYAHHHAEKAGQNVGQFMRGASGEQMKQMGDINQMGTLDFIKNHPALAANWYGRNALHKGFFVGLPAYEMGGVLTGKNPVDPEAGLGANVGQSLGSTLGMVAGMPLGLVGGTAGSMAAAEGGKRLGARVDRAFNLKPMGRRQEPLPPPPMSEPAQEQHWSPNG
jgi:hypothetical protein